MLVLFGQSSGPVPPIDPQVLNSHGSVFLTRPSLAHYLLTREELLWRAGDVLTAVAAGNLQLHVDRTYPLERAAACPPRSRVAGDNGEASAQPVRARTGGDFETGFLVTERTGVREFQTQPKHCRNIRIRIPLLILPYSRPPVAVANPILDVSQTPGPALYL